MTKKITLVGCGNIGSRHLQALVKLPFSTKIEVVDPNGNSQNLAKSRLNETEFEKSNFDLTWHSSLDKLNKSDVVIIATPSNNRSDLVKQLLEIGNKKILIEKMICQSDSEYDEILLFAKKNDTKVWVNASRRYYDSYKKIKTQITDSRINLIINAGNMGLGSNAIHFIDLFLWFVNDAQITLNGDYLDNKILINKRGNDFKEFCGTITGKSPSGSTLSINFLPFDNLPLHVNFFGDKNSFVIDETNERIYNFNNNIVEKFNIEYQSTLTTKIIQDIIENDISSLPTLNEMQVSHSELFRIFNSHIKKIMNMEVEKCPIT